MTDRQRITNILGAGTYPNFFLPKLCDACARLGATRGILTIGRFEFNRATASEPTHFGFDGIKDVSPSPDEIRNAIGNANSDEIAESNRDSWEPPAHGMMHKVIRALAEVDLVDGQTLWLQGLRTGHGIPAEEALRELKTRQPRQFITVASTLPDDFEKRDRLRDGHDLFFRLWQEKVIEAAFLLDNTSPFARSFSIDVQDRFEAVALASLLAAQFHFGRNPSFAEVTKSLGDYGAYIGMTFVSRSIAVGKEIPWWKLLRQGISSLPHRGSAPLANVLLEAQTATNLALTEAQAKAIEEPVNTNIPFYIVYTVPVSRSSSQWIEISREIRRWLSNTYPTATPIFASANGTPDPRYPGDYWVQASVLYPLPDVPAPIQKILDQKSLRRRGVSNAPQNRNLDLTTRRRVVAGEVESVRGRGTNHA